MIIPVAHMNDASTPSIMTWDTTKPGSATDRIVLPLRPSGTYNFGVYYQGSLLKTITTYTDNTVIFPDGAGVKEIRIEGQLEGFAFRNTGDKDKIIRMDSFGSGFKVASDQFCFGCLYLEYVGVLDVSGETDMYTWFQNCRRLVTIQDIENWDVSNAISIKNTFKSASLFNQDIGDWDVSSVTDMGEVVFRASIFNQDLSSWNVSSVTKMHQMLNNSSLSTANYDLLLCGWSSRPIQPNVNFGAGSTKYSASAKPCRDVFTNAGWTISDGGQV